LAYSFLRAIYLTQALLRANSSLAYSFFNFFNFFILRAAQVAGALGVDVVMIAPGGLGVSFDQLAMNKALLEKHGVYSCLCLSFRACVSRVLT
jgi:hypothetical protein